jgi:hypothetical protein
VSGGVGRGRKDGGRVRLRLDPPKELLDGRFVRLDVQKDAEDCDQAVGGNVREHQHAQDRAGAETKRERNEEDRAAEARRAKGSEHFDQQRPEEHSVELNRPRAQARGRLGGHEAVAADRTDEHDHDEAARVEVHPQLSEQIPVVGVFLTTVD